MESLRKLKTFAFIKLIPLTRITVSQIQGSFTLAVNSILRFTRELCYYTVTAKT